MGRGTRYILSRPRPKCFTLKPSSGAGRRVGRESGLVGLRALAVRGSGRVWPSCGPSRSARTSTCSRRTCLHFAPLISRAKKKAGQIGSGRGLLDSVRPLWVARLQRALDAVGPRRASSALPQASLRSDLEIIAMAAQVSGCHRFRCQDHFLHVLRHMVPLCKY